MNNLICLLLLLICSCQVGQQLARVSESSYTIDGDATLSTDSSVIRLIAPYKEQLDQEMNDIIAEAAITLTKARPQSTLGNWMADAIKLKAEAYLGRPIDLAVQNYGGIRIPELRKGPVTRGKIYELMPFENRITVLELNASTLQRFLDHTAASGGWPVSKELRMLIDGDRATAVTLSGAKLQENKTYLLALPDYIANGGDGIDFFKDIKRTDLPQLIREALIEYAEDLQREGKRIDAEVDHRVKMKQ